MRLNAEKLTAAIADKGLSQTALAARIGIKVSTLNDLIKRAHLGMGCHPATPKRLGKALGVKASELIDTGEVAAR